MTDKKAEEEKKAHKLRLKKKLLLDETEKIGFWKSKEKVKERVSKIVSENERVKILSFQIQFKVVVSLYHPDNDISVISEGDKV